MNLSYNERQVLFNVVRQAKLEHYTILNEVNQKFKENDNSMRGDKEQYWLKKQAEAYELFDHYVRILEELQNTL